MGNVWEDVNKGLIGEQEESEENIFLKSILKQQEARLLLRSPYQVAKLILERWVVRLVLSPSSAPSCVTSWEYVWP